MTLAEIKELWAQTVHGRDLRCPTERAAIDRALTARVMQIVDPPLRAHSAALLRQFRDEAFGFLGNRDLAARVSALEGRLAEATRAISRLEAHYGGTDDWREATDGIERRMIETWEAAE